MSAYPSAVQVLANVVERVAPRDPEAWAARPALKRGVEVSAARARQLRFTVRQLASAVGHADMPPGCGESLQVLLSAEGVDTFLDLAADGTFRDAARPALLGRPLSWNALASLRDCVKILAEETDIEVRLPRIEGMVRGPQITPAQAAALYRRLADQAAANPQRPFVARTLAAVAVILDTGMQTGDMVTRRLEHLDLETGTLECLYRPQNFPEAEGVTAVLPLREGTVIALKGWLEHRQRLVDALEGQDPEALWVTVKPSPRSDGSSYEAGLPLLERGFRRAHRRGVSRLNELLAGAWDEATRGPWRPLPTTPEALRRVVDVDALVPELAELHGRNPEVVRPEPWAAGPHPGVPAHVKHGEEYAYNEYDCRCKDCYLQMVKLRALRKDLKAG
ncbi:hypothetical protein [Streptomyces olivaceiscleroticus]|uniref:Tyr recombinase domain-containing protein n=1 Tax=Streptomyces olivaceiscleroticus TaxID=68245 RepID=A0ABN1BND4_9ACTN